MAPTPRTSAETESSDTTETEAPTLALPPEVASRFVTAAESPAPTQDQIAVVRQNAGAILAAAEQINQLPDSRHKSLSLTSLEEALMWANKAVFA